MQQPIAMLLTLTCVMFTVCAPLVQMNTFGEEGRLARDGGLAFMLFFGIIVTGFSAGFTVSDEIRKDTAATVFAKPVSRSTFIVGKWLGICFVIALFCATCYISTLLAERTAEHTLSTKDHFAIQKDFYAGFGSIAAALAALVAAAVMNYRRHARFGLSAVIYLFFSQLIALLALGCVNRVGVWPGSYDMQVNWHITNAAICIFAMLVMYSALTTALAVRLNSIGATVVACAMLFLSIISDAVFAGGASLAMRFLYAVVPNIQNFWLADALTDGGSIPLRLVAHVIVYAVCYSALFLALGSALLSRRDIS